MTSPRVRLRFGIIFAALWLAYQLPGTAAWLGHPDLAPALMLAFLPLAWLVARIAGRTMGEAYGLEVRARPLSMLAAGFALAAGVKLGSVFLGRALGIFTDGTTPASSLGIATVAWLLISTFVPSLAEDIVTRGTFLRLAPITFTAGRFVGLTSLVYVLNHTYRLANGPSEWLMLFSFGAAYAAACWQAGSLWAAVGLHWGWNFAGQAIDTVWPLDTASPLASRMLSTGAHLLLLGVVLLISWFHSRASRLSISPSTPE